jgi:ubiquitin-protein ligase
MSNHNICKDNLLRLVKDIKQVLKEDISKDGIYYKHDETNILLGYALIIGSENTPYAYGNFLFKFSFPEDYPYSPPVVSYLTNDGVTRFHPNLYKNEKVCLSILNTWKGEGWTSCQNIKSILLILKSILDNKPLTHEPGITENHRDFNTYNEIIKYKTIEVAIGKIIRKKIYPDICEIFWNEIIQNFINNYDKILLSIPSNSQIIEIKTSIYNMNAKINYIKYIDLLSKIYNLNKNITHNSQ